MKKKDKKKNVIISKDFLSRIKCAAKNGSVIASDILQELNSGLDISELIRGNANNFQTKKIVCGYEYVADIRIDISACIKDVESDFFPDANNPNAMHSESNRTSISATKFVQLFKRLPDYSNHDLEYFTSAICVNTVIKLKIYSDYYNFKRAYLKHNYSSYKERETPLHNSCMKSEDASEVCADFYTNFVGCSILVATGENNEVYGRALVFKNAVCGKIECVSILDRIYFSHNFVRNMIINYAQNKGIHFRKYANDYNSPKKFVALNANPFEIEVGEHAYLGFLVKCNHKSYFKKGAPYLDTFHDITIVDNQICLHNDSNSLSILSLRSSELIAKKNNFICPSCGRTIHCYDSDICEDCANELTDKSMFGINIKKTAIYKDIVVPRQFVYNNGKPKTNFFNYLQLKKLCEQ